MMTKTDKTAIFFINMRIAVNNSFGQLTRYIHIFIIFITLILSGCNSKKDEIPVIPPLTSPLTGDYIGFGVITASFTHVTDAPTEDSVSLGYLRRGSLVRIIKRQTIRTGNVFISWVLADGNFQQGWLREDIMDIYDNESQARTASEAMVK